MDLLSYEPLRNCLDWLVSNLLWEGLVAFLVIIFATYSSFRISKFLITQNRYTKGNGWGTHLADRYIDCWRFKKGLSTSEGGFYANPNSIPSRWWLEVIDKKLEEKQLVIIKEKKVYPIISLRNRLIIKILRYYLIHVTGDNKNEYNNL
jgi:hypothetical protein